MTDPKIRRISGLLIEVYNDILQVEEKYLRTSRFKDITVKEVHTIDAITMYDHKTTTAVARKLQLSPGTVTASIDKLVKKGYVVRLQSADDQRVIRLGLTRRGRLIYRAHESFHRQMTETFLGDMDTSQVDLIERAMLNLRSFLEIATEKGDSNEDN
ncbi:MarR family winged helix-turn-helix transcriptional regulator [Oenococcus kitaharae]|uniref:Transcriptional regulator of fatty acid biosynthesis FabT n=1 Tax=Oenococcus kitaharae DSM 17330 TaxID=1045004 RepID=G9WEV3_9LACO|nr:MarR family transcriptional regulator [Oenococcus kitaharae]EHN58276.1 Transcriptional regulator of fatty acid biosynthesis FabT [Oenococcus kitaharae DSM 17330]OEY81545.1 MarR family transcriptional regulator [Oenococcus kitaharae]OEY83032.1 MarR family transcriptional regulator [Oenococcus kitaharae]OEY84423.1 MarR family transcriptional regulator [Oenococcus kitaharae]